MPIPLVPRPRLSITTIKSPTGPRFFSPRLYVLVDAALSPDPTYVARTLVYVKVPKLTGLVSPIQTQLPPFGKKPSHRPVGPSEGGRGWYAYTPPGLALVWTLASSGHTKFSPTPPSPPYVIAIHTPPKENTPVAPTARKKKTPPPIMHCISQHKLTSLSIIK